MKPQSARTRQSSPYLRRMVASGEDFLLTPYSPHSWWHADGRRAMVRRLEAKGFPPLWGWLFLTLTIDPEEFTSPEGEPEYEKAYEAGADRVRRMVHKLREAGYVIERYFSKLELHESGFPHWHLGVDCREYIANEEVQDAWGLGFVKTKRVKKTRDFKYLFKYVVKDNGELPDWVLDYPRRIRVFQTSVGFYGKPQSSSKSEPSGEAKKKTLRVKFSEWSVRGVVRVRELSYRGIAVDLRATYPEIFIHRVESGARALDAYHIPLHLENIEEYILPWKPKQQQPKSPPPQRRSIWDRSRMARISSPGVPSPLSGGSSAKTASEASCT